MKLLSKFERATKNVILGGLYFYRGLLSIHIGGGCRFEPSCSEFACECFQKHDLKNATRLTLGRLSKCHPWGEFGYDPVPDAKEMSS